MTRADILAELAQLEDEAHTILSAGSAAVIEAEEARKCYRKRQRAAANDMLRGVIFRVTEDRKKMDAVIDRAERLREQIEREMAVRS